MTDKKDPIQLAAEEYQRALEESISKKKEELIEKKRAQAAAEQEAQELTEAEQKLQEIQAKRAIIRRLRELKEAEERGEDIQEISESVEEESQKDELVEVRSAMDNYVDAIKTHEKKKPVSEDANLLGGGTGGEVSRAEFQALKTSLASLGGGGLGEKDVIDLINIHAPGGSADSGGLDSSQVLNLISDSYVSNLIGILQNQTAVTFGTPDSAGDVNNIYNILGIDSSDTLVTNQGDSITNIWQILGADSNSTIIQNSGTDSNSIWTILGIDSSDTISTYGDSDVISLLNDSGVQNILPQLDSTYDLGDSDRRWKDLWLSGNTIHLGDVAVSSRGDSGVGVYANGRRLAYADSYENGLDSTQVIRLIDSALDSTGAGGYTTADHDSDTLVQVDSAYVQARVTFPVDSVGLDSSAVAALIDSALDSLGAHYTTANHDSDTLAQVDSAYVQARQIKYLDSAQITNLIDSAYVAARDSDGGFYTTADHDSDTLVQVDSAYVRARVKTDQDLSTTDIVTFDQVFANLDGAIEFKANNRSGGTILKGQPVYINGVDGNKPTIALADANDPDKMPAFGLLLEDANDNADAIVVTFGTLKNVDTSAFNLGDTLYIGTTPGALVTTPPAGVNSLIQNIGRVIRSDGSAGSIKVGGAGRSNATPNLSAGQIFYGNDSDRAVPTLATDVFDSDYINSLVDNPFLHELQDVQIDSTTLASDEFLQWNGSVWTHRPLTIETSLTFNGSIDVTVDSAPAGASGGALYVNTGDGTALGSWTGVAGDSFQSGQTVAWSDSDARWYQMGVSTSGSILEVRAGLGITVDDSDAERPVVSINRAVTDQFYLDSAEGIILIDERIPVIVDSAYVNLRSDHYTRSQFESDALEFVDSAYINARSDHYTTANHDSDTLVQVDSAYVNARSDHYTTADHDSDTLIQVDSAYVQARQLTGGTVTVDSVAPAGASDGDFWYDPTTSVLSIRDSGAWDSIGGSSDSGDFVLVSGDSMTGKLFAPTIQITGDPNDSNRTTLLFTGEDSDHVVEAKDGVVNEWNQLNSNNDQARWKAIAYGTNSYIAVGSTDFSDTNKSNITRSTTGLSWTATDSYPTYFFSGVAYGNGTYVISRTTAGAFVNSGQFLYSTDEGVNWDSSGPSNQFQVHDVTYAAGQFVAVGNSGLVNYSTDGINWSGGSGAANDMQSVSYGNGLWVAVADEGTNRIMTSTDGINWTQRTAPEQNRWVSVAYGNGIWVAVSNDGTNRIMTSTDGINWTARSVAYANAREWLNIEFVKDRFLALGEWNSPNNGVMYSYDGINWTGQDPAQDGISWNGSVYSADDDLIVMVGSTPFSLNVFNYINTTGEVEPGLYYDENKLLTAADIITSADVVTLIQQTVDSAYVAARDSDTVSDYGDSAVIALVDSAYVNARSDHYTTADHDSDTLIQVDSAYVQARQLTGGTVTVDSVAPASSVDGDFWYQPSSGVLHIRDSGLWDSINAQDSGAYLLLSGGTVTGPLNLDSGGIQFGPDSDRIKLYTGFSTFADPTVYGDSITDTWEATAGSAEVPEAIVYNDSADRLVAISNRTEVYYSDDQGLSWQRASNDAVVDAVNLKYFPPLGTATEGIYIASDANSGTTSGVYYSDNGDSWQAADFSIQLAINPDRVDNLYADHNISRGLDDSDNPVFYIGSTYNRGYYRSIPGTNGTQYEYRNGQNGIEGRFPAASTGFRNDTLYVRGTPVYSYYHSKWFMIAGSPDTAIDNGTAQGQRVWTSPDGDVWTATGVGGLSISRGGYGSHASRTETLGPLLTDFIEDPRTGYVMLYAMRPPGNRAAGILVTTDGGTTWFSPKFKVGDDVGARSVFELGTTDTHRAFEIFNVAYDRNAGIFYAMGRADRENYNGIGTNGPLREFFSSDLLNWVMGPEIASTNANMSRGGLIQMPDGEFLRVGRNASGSVSTFSKSGYGVVTEGVGSLKFGEDVVLTSDNYNRYIPSTEPLATDIETSGAVFYPNGGYLSPPIGGWGNVGFTNDEIGQSGRDFYLYGNKMEAASITWIASGQYRVRFADWNVDNDQYIVTATIEATGIFTASARTAMIYDKSEDGFDVILQRTDTSSMNDADTDITSVSLTIVSKI